MKNRVVLFVICFCINNFSQTTVLPQFSELKGMEDEDGNTHLFYRIYTRFENDPMYWWSKNIYHWDLETDIDTLFISDSGIEVPTGNSNRWVSDVDFWNNNIRVYIYSGGYSMGPYSEGSAFVERFDGFTNYFGGFWGSANYIDIALSNDSILYLGIYTEGGFGVLKSMNGGRNWDSLSTEYQFLSLNLYNENIFFVENEERQLFRTTDSGNTFNLVDPEFLPDTRFYYDPDEQHIYRKANNKLIVSDNLGEPFSWQTVFTKSSTNPFYFCNDISVSGSIFMCERRSIYHSTDYGYNFNLIRTLERNIVGIYKKPNSNKLYAATKYKIYEINPDTLTVIKELPIPDEVFSWFPLNIGNKWIYDSSESIEYNNEKWKTSREVVENRIIQNQVYIKVQVSKYYDDSNIPREIKSQYFRVDSSTVLIYMASVENDTVRYQELYMDLLAEINDTIHMDNGVRFTSEIPYNLFGIDTYRREFEYVITPYQIIDLVKGFGLEYKIWAEVGAEAIDSLKGCIINGVVYGDTSLITGVENKSLSVFNFKLEQNYPNPFNPTTTIKYRISETGLITLKVYDILGRKVATLVNEEKLSGSYKVEFDRSNLSSGVYFYRMQSGDFIDTKKFVIIK